MNSYEQINTYLGGGFRVFILKFSILLYVKIFHNKMLEKLLPSILLEIFQYLYNRFNNLAWISEFSTPSNSIQVISSTTSCNTMLTFLSGQCPYLCPQHTILISAFLPFFILFPMTLNTYNHLSTYLKPIHPLGAISDFTFSKMPSLVTLV